MVADMARLRKFSQETGVGFDKLAETAEMDLSTFYRKVKSDGEGFTIGEVHKMVESKVLPRDEAILIFLPSNSHKCESTVENVGFTG